MRFYPKNQWRTCVRLAVFVLPTVHAAQHRTAHTHTHNPSVFENTIKHNARTLFPSDFLFLYR